MAAGKNVWQQKVFKINQSKSNGFLQSCLHTSAEKNMKQVDIINKEELDKDRLQVHRRVRIQDEAKRLSSCKRKSCPLVEAGLKLHRRTSDVGRSCDPGMANKENELTCSDDVRGVHYNDNRGLPVNSTEASKMAGASSKYSDFTELSKDHEAMTHVLFGRNLRLKVALTLWRKNASELVAYLIRIQDTGVLLDCLPVLTNKFQQTEHQVSEGRSSSVTHLQFCASTQKLKRNGIDMLIIFPSALRCHLYWGECLQAEAPCLSLGCCVDLMPQVKMILTSKYEEHIVVGLHWVQSVIRKWWPELSKNEKRLRDSCSEDRNIEVMKQRLKDLWKEGARLCTAPGSIGELAKAIEAYLLQLP